ncbi:hypothetical protein [Rufibacter quisquiliarum]|uniref:hypothetical protein n=1 Tax=Rufibacter quisquiliarum TaxID=1549639 RepID=UPI0015FB99F5|nr:hypothetical protein [Rufibacter quisquiliarum]
MSFIERYYRLLPRFFQKEQGEKSCSKAQLSAFVSAILRYSGFAIPNLITCGFAIRGACCSKVPRRGLQIPQLFASGLQIRKSV